MTRFILGSLLAVLITSAQAASVALAWTASTDNVGVTGYDVFRSGTKVGTSTTNSYTDTTAADNTQYSYTVQAFDAAGNRSGTSTPVIIKTGTIIILPAGEDHTFTALHTYYMAPASASPAGNDGNSGTDITHPWLTPNHAAVVCGDVILAQPGAYAAQNLTTQPGSCPSSSGGIDGSGQIYVATVLCAGASVGDCTISATGGGGSGGAVFVIKASNWAVSGWKITGDGTKRAFEADASASGTTLLHHIAFINNIATNVAQGFDDNEGALNHNVPGNGTDQFGIIGNIAQNAAQDTICLAAIDEVGAANQNSDPGTHKYIAGNFSYNHTSTCGSDVEAYMIDTLDAHGYTGQIVWKDNMGWRANRACMQFTNHDINLSATNVYFYQNTCWGNNQNIGNDSGAGEINLQGFTAANWTWVTNIYNNIAQTSNATSPCCVAGILYASNRGNCGASGSCSAGWDSTITEGGGSVKNIYKGLASSCTGTCNTPNFDVATHNSGVIGVDTYVTASFKNTADLLSRHTTATIDCHGFTNVTACMGWDNVSRVLAPQSVIDDLTPTAGGMTGKGYQVPQPCAADALYATWLKGIVFLQASGFVNGATITEKAGLITKPCGM